MNTGRISHHAKDRSRERLGLKASSVARMAEMALTQGLAIGDTAGQLRHYLEAKLIEHPGTEQRIYGEVLFVFGRANTLITCWQIPREHRATVKKIKEASRR